MSAKKKSKDKLYIKQSISLSPEMIETMKQIAQQERRSLSNMMQIAAEFYLKHKDDKIIKGHEAAAPGFHPDGLHAAEPPVKYSGRHILPNPEPNPLQDQTFQKITTYSEFLHAKKQLEAQNNAESTHHIALHGLDVETTDGNPLQPQHPHVERVIPAAKQTRLPIRPRTAQRLTPSQKRPRIIT
jgi:predicted transcriptional regulator